jgi:hypothetical protein
MLFYAWPKKQLAAVAVEVGEEVDSADVVVWLKRGSSHVPSSSVPARAVVPGHIVASVVPKEDAHRTVPLPMVLVEDNGTHAVDVTSFSWLPERILKALNQISKDVPRAQ